MSPLPNAAAYFGGLASNTWQSVKKTLQDSTWITYDLEYPGEEELARRRRADLTSSNVSTMSSSRSEHASQHSIEDDLGDSNSTGDEGDLLLLVLVVLVVLVFLMVVVVVVVFKEHSVLVQR